MWTIDRQAGRRSRSRPAGWGAATGTPRTSRSRMLGALTAAVAIAVPGAPAVAAATDDDTPPPAQVIVEWNRAMMDNLRNAPGPVAIRIGAIVQSSVFDAVNGITRRYTEFHETRRAPHRASATAAAAGAAYQALRLLFPSAQATFDALLARTVPDRSHGAAARGVAWGESVADDIVNWRSTDGFTAVPPPYVLSPAPGRWKPTPPLFGPPIFRQFATMVPFAIASPTQFQPPAPPALDSARYATDYAEVKAYGRIDSAVRTARGTETALLWGSDAPVDVWDTVADTLIGGRHLGLTDATRLMAQMNIAMADAVIAVWNAKNLFDRWRPITAIEQAATDGNPATEPDPTWQPLLATPPFQEYPSGHAGASQSAAAVLAHRFGNSTQYSITTPNLPGVTHSFASFTAGVAEVTDARVFIGFHFRFACNAADVMGRGVAGYVLATQMRPRDG